MPLNRIDALQVGVYGNHLSFVSTGFPVYWGAFWTPISSVPFDGLAIEQPINNQTNTLPSNGLPDFIIFSPASTGWMTGPIQESFQQAGKLISPPEPPLPQSMKGYELYSWLSERFNGTTH